MAEEVRRGPLKGLAENYTVSELVAAIHDNPGTMRELMEVHNDPKLTAGAKARIERAINKAIEMAAY